MAAVRPSSSELDAAVPLDGPGTGRLEEIGGGGLRRLVARGSIVNTIWLVGLNTLTLSKGVIVAGYLGAEAYGLWGLLTVCFGTLFALGAVGVNDKYIQQDYEDQQRAFEIAFTLQAMLCGVFTLLALLAIPAFAALYDEPAILVPGLVLSFAFPLIALQTPVWVFYRRMRFLRQRVLQSFDPVISTVVTISLAVAGLGLWSLVIGSLAGALVAALVAVLNSPYRLRFRYEKGTIAEYASFSWPLLLGSLSGIVTGLVLITLASRSLGAAAVGAIALATSISAYTKRVDEIVTHALYPAICAVKDRTDLLFESFSKSNRLALMWGFPCGIALALFATDIVHVVLGDGWVLAIPVIQMLGLTAAVDQIGFNWGAFAQARAETRPLAVAGVVAMVAMIATGVPLMLSEGVVGYAYAVAAGTLSGLVVRSVYLVRIFPSLRFAAHVGRAITPTVLPAAGLLLERALAGGTRSTGYVAAEAVAYAALVIGGTLLLERSLLREAVGYVGRAQGSNDAA